MWRRNRSVSNSGQQPRFWASYDRGLALGMYLHDTVNLVAMRQWAKGYADGDRTALLDRALTTAS